METGRGQISREERELLLVEYQKAQDSAQHHETLAWMVTSITWGASLVLLGFISKNLIIPELRLFNSILGCLGIILILAECRLASVLNDIKLQKYEHCKEIERKVGFSQHSKLRDPNRKIHKILFGLVTLLFLSCWLAVIWIAWSTPCSGI